jgi:hypothetical protein
MTQPETELKSRRLAYYNFDKQQTQTRIFSALEIAHTNKIFDTVEDILLESDHKLRNKWVSSGRCSCGTHQDTFFNVEVDTDILEMTVVDDIKEALEEYSKDVKLHP